MYKYSRVFYQPLKQEEARACLQDFVRKVVAALQEFHKLNLAHLDVRLPNLCINENFDVVLIDVDFSKAITVRPPISSSSCLYNIPSTPSDIRPAGQRTDYMQVGWMIAYIIDSSDDEHYRKWENQPPEIQNNSFIEKLVRKCQYDESLLFELVSLGGSETLTEVLTTRSNP